MDRIMNLQDKKDEYEEAKEVATDAKALFDEYNMNEVAAADLPADWTQALQDEFEVSFFDLQGVALDLQRQVAEIEGLKKQFDDAEDAAKQERAGELAEAENNRPGIVDTYFEAMQTYNEMNIELQDPNGFFDEEYINSVTNAFYEAETAFYENTDMLFQLAERDAREKARDVDYKGVLDAREQKAGDDANDLATVKGELDSKITAAAAAKKHLEDKTKLVRQLKAEVDKMQALIDDNDADP
jgi:hypothetical protein